jgi:hypothetical protein
VRRPSRFGLLPAFALACGGLLGGHALSYLLAFPAASQREHVLRSTGHGYLPGANEAALLLVVSIVGATLLRAAAGRAEAGLARPGIAAAAGMALAQAGVFLALEIAERLASGSPLAELASDHLLAIGLAIQAAVGLAAALALRLLARAATSVASSTTARRVAWAPPGWVGAPARPPRTPRRPGLGPACGVRGPPILRPV